MCIFREKSRLPWTPERPAAVAWLCPVPMLARNRQHPRAAYSIAARRALVPSKALQTPIEKIVITSMFYKESPKISSREVKKLQIAFPRPLLSTYDLAVPRPLPSTYEAGPASGGAQSGTPHRSSWRWRENI